MTLSEIDLAFDNFFGFPAEDRSVVISTCKLFARHIAQEHAATLQAELDAERARVAGLAETPRERDVREACAELRTVLGNPVISGNMHQTLHGQTIRMATARIAALEKDAARYRWLRAFPNNVRSDVYGPTHDLNCGGLLRRDTHLDKAIDAAMAATAGDGAPA